MNLPRRLETKRLILRPNQPQDFDAFFALLNNNEATRFLSFTEEEKTLEAAQAFFNEILASQDTPDPVFALVVTEKDSGEFVGVCGLSSIEDENSAELYYVFVPSHWGKGYAGELGQSLIHYAFTRLELDDIIVFIPPDNSRGIKVAEKNGMRYERLVDHRGFRGKVRRYRLHKSAFEVRFYGKK